MSSLTTLQVVTLVPATELAQLRRQCAQPRGTHPRRERNVVWMNELVEKARTVYEKGHISKKAHDFLAGWATGVRRRIPRPSQSA